MVAQFVLSRRSSPSHLFRMALYAYTPLRSYSTSSREDSDTFGLIDVPSDRSRGDQKQRSLRNFVDRERMPKPISRTILVNSPKCSTRRVAVLEDQKLVELWLEPEIGVQYGNIYLGIFSKFLPHMGSAIIDIGISRPALLNTEQNPQPFILNQQVVNGWHADISYGNDSKKTVMNENKWLQVRKGTKMIVQVVEEEMGTEGPKLTAYPQLRSNFLILMTRCDRIVIPKEIPHVESRRLRLIAETLRPQGFGLTVRTPAVGHSLEEIEKDFKRLLLTWKGIIENKKSVDEDIEGVVPVTLYKAPSQTISFLQEESYEKVKRVVVDSKRIYHQVIDYFREIAPDLCDRVEFFKEIVPLFDYFSIEEEANRIFNRTELLSELLIVPLANGGYLMMEQTEALLSIYANGGQRVLDQDTTMEKAILEVNLAAARWVVKELRLRDIGGLVLVDFINMKDESNKKLVLEELTTLVQKDRSTVSATPITRCGIMEITRMRVRPSVNSMLTEPCGYCKGTRRVETLESIFAKIELEICRQRAKMENLDYDYAENRKSCLKFKLVVDHHLHGYLTSRKRSRLEMLIRSLKVWIRLKVDRRLERGAFVVSPYEWAS